MNLSKRTMMVTWLFFFMGLVVSATMAPSTTWMFPLKPKAHTLVLSGVQAGPPVLFTMVTRTCCGPAIIWSFTNWKLKPS